MLRVGDDMEARTRSYLPIVLVLAAGVGGAGCIEEVRHNRYCVVLWFENHTPQPAEVSFWVTPASATQRLGNDNPWHLEPKGHDKDEFGILWGVYNRTQLLSVRHESGGFANYTVLAEPIPSHWTVVEYGAQGITFSTRDTRDEGWKDNPCN